MHLQSASVAVTDTHYSGLNDSAALAQFTHANEFWADLARLAASHAQGVAEETGIFYELLGAF